MRGSAIYPCCQDGFVKNCPNYSDDCKASRMDDTLRKESRVHQRGGGDEGRTAVRYRGLGSDCQACICLPSHLPYFPQPISSFIP
jgi:hypothetical protein